MITSTIDIRLIPTPQYATPTTGQTVTANGAGFDRIFINPAGSLLALTIAFPGSPTDGDVVEFASSQAVTTLTMSGGTIVAALTSLIAGGGGRWSYSATAGKWFLFP